jgi:hypothetical protein
MVDVTMSHPPLTITGNLAARMFSPLPYNLRTNCILIWFIRQSSLSLTNQVAEDTILATTALLYFREFIH